MKNITIQDKVFELFIHNNDIKSSIINLAKVFNNNLKDKKPIFLVILNGSFMFAGELFQNLNFDCEISFLKLTSYSGTSSSGNVKKLIGLNEDIKGRTVVILEDIVDTGITMDHIIKQLEGYKPSEILISTLIFKPKSYKLNYKIDYFCFEIPNEFIVGYGLDYNGFGRNLKHIYKLKD
jgi:hypoxanthine phosphoribosyltransferase